MYGYSPAFSLPKLIVVIYARDAASLISKLADACCAGWERHVSVRVLNAPKVNMEEYTDEIIDEFFNASSSMIFFQPGLLDKDLLDSEEVRCRPCATTKTMFQAMTPELMSLKIHWKSYAESQWEKSTLKSASPEQWVQQFAELGHRDIGRHLLKSLRVVTDAEIREAFKPAPYDDIGVRIAHGYIHEDEPGSSSIAIKSILEHMHPQGVIPIDLSNPDMFAFMNVDVLYIYEDGLWSGVEVVNRLQALSQNEALMRSNLQIVFRYCVTCDAGLSAARLFSVRNSAGKFQFPSAKPGFHFSFLQNEVDTRFPALTDRSDQSIRTAIDSVIEPYAFASSEIWGQERDASLGVCSKIGSQLVRYFLERKADGSESGESVVIPPEKIARMQLGAMSFASTIVFASSIPKPVLPVMWLGGEVTLSNRTVNWLPLFWDARRTGSVDH